MVRIEERDLVRLEEKDIAAFYEGLCGIKFPGMKARDVMAGFFKVSTRTYDKIKIGEAHASAESWIRASRELETTIWFDWVTVSWRKSDDPQPKTQKNH